MITRWSDMPGAIRRMAEFRDQMDRLFNTYAGGVEPRHLGAAGPPVNLYDTGEAIVLEAELPGVRLEDLEVTAHRDVVRISGKRTVMPPEGYKAHRREREDYSFTRAFGLPCHCDVERVKAVAKDGILTVTLAKAPEAKPRQISVSAQ